MSRVTVSVDSHDPCCVTCGAILSNVIPASVWATGYDGREHAGACPNVPANTPRDPLPLILTCPSCNARHIDEGTFATKPHHTHACQSCGMNWRPANVYTVGVQFLPGCKNKVPA